MTPRARDTLGLLVAALVVAGCVRLGFWQVSRLRQRRARNAVMRAGMQAPPVDLAAGVSPDSLQYRRVRARGTFDYDHERFWRPRLMEDMPGVDLVTPLRLGDGSAVLVDRGWVPSADGYHVDQRSYREPDSASVVGLALSAPRSHGDVDPRALSDSFPYRLMPFVVQQLPAGAGGHDPDFPRRWAMPELNDGPHLSYAIQWFSFAVITVIGVIALYRRDRRERGRPLPPQSPVH